MAYAGRNTFFSKHTAAMAHCQQTDLMQKSNGVYLELMDKYEKDVSMIFKALISNMQHKIKDE